MQSQSNSGSVTASDEGPGGENHHDGSGMQRKMYLRFAGAGTGATLPRSACRRNLEADEQPPKTLSSSGAHVADTQRRHDEVGRSSRIVLRREPHRSAPAPVRPSPRQCRQA
jgi:hypothetical protein